MLRNPQPAASSALVFRFVGLFIPRLPSSLSVDFVRPVFLVCVGYKTPRSRIPSDHVSCHCIVSGVSCGVGRVVWGGLLAVRGMFWREHVPGAERCTSKLLVSVRSGRGADRIGRSFAAPSRRSSVHRGRSASLIVRANTARPNDYRYCRALGHPSPSQLRFACGSPVSPVGKFVGKIFGSSVIIHLYQLVVISTPVSVEKPASDRTFLGESQRL